MSTQFAGQAAFSVAGLAHPPKVLELTQGEQLQLAFGVTDLPSGQPVSFADWPQLGVHLRGYGSPIVRSTYGFDVDPSAVHVGDQTVLVGAPQHGLVNGDWLYFDGRAPLAWQQANMRRQIVAQVVSPDSFIPVDLDGQPILPGSVSGPFTVAAKYDLEMLDNSPTAFVLHLRKPVTQQLYVGRGQSLELHLQSDTEQRIVRLDSVLDVYSGLR